MKRKNVRGEEGKVGDGKWRGRQLGLAYGCCRIEKYCIFADRKILSRNQSLDYVKKERGVAYCLQKLC